MEGISLDSQDGKGNLPFSRMPRGNLGVTQSPIQWVKGAFYQGVKRPGRLADYIPSSRSEAKNRWTCISISPFTFMM
jgi:hypothetical protein